VSLLIIILQQLCSANSSTQQAGNQQLAIDAPVLSAAAVRLVLELQLLAAGEAQRQQQQQQQQEQERHQAVRLLLICNQLLSTQVAELARLSYSSSSSSCCCCLLPELLQQHGLQLLQALAALVQQLQISAGGLSAWMEFSSPAVFGQQLSVLRAAASGISAVDSLCTEGDFQSSRSLPADIVLQSIQI
jgi:hypothetical protein